MQIANILYIDLPIKLWITVKQTSSNLDICSDRSIFFLEKQLGWIQIHSAINFQIMGGELFIFQPAASLYWSPNFMYTTLSCYGFIRSIWGSLWNGIALKYLRGTNEYGFIVFFHQFEVVDRRLVPSKSLNLVWKLKVNNIRLEGIAVIYM